MNLSCLRKLLLNRAIILQIILALMLASLSAGTDESSIQSEISRYKRIKRDEMLEAKVKKECMSDTLFSINGNFVTIQDSSGKPTPVELRGRALSLYHFDNSQDMEQFLEELFAGGKTTDTLSSFVYRIQLKKRAEELRSLIGALSTHPSLDIARISFDSLIFENYFSNDLSSETRIINGRYVVFMNDRLLDFCTWMADLTIRLLVPVEGDSTTLRFPRTESEAIEKMENAQPRMVELINHYLYDCPVRFLEPDMRVIVLRDFMEMFVIAHEYAHANFDHASYASAYADTLSSEESQEIALNSWMHEIQADNLALVVLLAKYWKDFSTDEHFWLAVAGMFYMTCVEILERSELVIAERSNDADTVISAAYDVFGELMLKFEEFPTAIDPLPQYSVDDGNKHLISRQVDPKNPNRLRSHPPALSRVDIQAATLRTLIDSERELSAVEYGEGLCQAILTVFESIKEELWKDQN